jgi:hypothetical protein
MRLVILICLAVLLATAVVSAWAVTAPRGTASVAGPPAMSILDITLQAQPMPVHETPDAF